MEMMVETSRTTVVVAVSFCVIVLCVLAVFVSSRKPRIDRRVSNVAVSSTGSWLAAGTAQGKITVWNHTNGTAPQQITFSTALYGELNDLRFSPDEHVLAIASGDLGMYAPAESARPRLLRSDHENYGSVRFSQDGQNLLVVTGAAVIETLDAHSGALRLKVCCSSIYGEVTFTPDGEAIANAGHWPSLWDARSGELLGRLTTHREFETFRPIAFDDRRGTILMGSQDGRVYAWNLSKRQLVAISPPQSAYVDTLAASTTGWVVFAGFGKSVELWNPDTGQRRSWTAARPTSNLVLGPDGTSIIFGTANGTVEFWDIKTEQRIRALKISGT
jgi:WD40 repeat protein